jgi:hypothetical protein
MEEGKNNSCSYHDTARPACRQDMTRLRVVTKWFWRVGRFDLSADAIFIDPSVPELVAGYTSGKLFDGAFLNSRTGKVQGTPEAVMLPRYSQHRPCGLVGMGICFSLDAEASFRLFRTWVSRCRLGRIRLPGRFFCLSGRVDP